MKKVIRYTVTPLPRIPSVTVQRFNALMRGSR
jgi:hypothetical protein